MRIIYCGSGEFGLPCLKEIAGSDRHELVHVFTQPAQPAGRGKKLRPTPVAQWALENGPAVSEAANINDQAILQQVRGLEPDLLVVIAFGQKLSQELIKIPRKGAINVHASLLPKYRGAAPINWAIINGEEETGVSIITLADKMDAGLILAQARTQIGEDETASELHDRLAVLAAPVLLETINAVEENRANYEKQDASLVTRAPKMKKSDAFIDWQRTGKEICNMIRGFWAWPEAQSYYVSRRTGRCERVIFAACRAAEGSGESRPGVLDENLHVACRGGAVKLLKVKPAGSSLMDFKAFVNGRGCEPGDYFMPIDAAKEQSEKAK